MFRGIAISVAVIKSYALRKCPVSGIRNRQLSSGEAGGVNRRVGSVASVSDGVKKWLWICIIIPPPDTHSRCCQQLYR